MSTRSSHGIVQDILANAAQEVIVHFLSILEHFWVSSAHSDARSFFPKTSRWFYRTHSRDSLDKILLRNNSSGTTTRNTSGNRCLLPFKALSCLRCQQNKHKHDVDPNQGYIKDGSIMLLPSFHFFLRSNRTFPHDNSWLPIQNVKTRTIHDFSSTSRVSASHSVYILVVPLLTENLWRQPPSLRFNYFWSINWNSSNSRSRMSLEYWRSVVKESIFEWLAFGCRSQKSTGKEKLNWSH